MKMIKRELWYEIRNKSNYYVKEISYFIRLNEKRNISVSVLLAFDFVYLYSSDVK